MKKLLSLSIAFLLLLSVSAFTLSCGEEESKEDDTTDLVTEDLYDDDGWSPVWNPGE